MLQSLGFLFGDFLFSIYFLSSSFILARKETKTKQTEIEVSFLGQKKNTSLSPVATSCFLSSPQERLSCDTLIVASSFCLFHTWHVHHQIEEHHGVAHVTILAIRHDLLTNKSKSIALNIE